MKARRMRWPSSVRMGMFCRFGLAEESGRSRHRLVVPGMETPVRRHQAGRAST